MSAPISPRLAQDARFSSNLSLTTGKAEQLSKSDFSDLFRESLGEVDKLEQQAHRTIEGLMTGNGVDVHQALIAAEKANAAFDLTLAVRNKAIQSYQSVMSMQF
jgi:flagellar hook-basal body complex protein FliE